MGELEQYGRILSRIGSCGTSSKNVSSVDSNMFINYKKAYQKQGAMVDNDNFT